MSEKSLTSEDKEILKRRLELLQIEYERTAQRLQRAERREAIRRHVQNRISGQNQLLQVNTARSVQGSSTASNSDLLSNHTQLLDTSEKPPQVHFLLTEAVEASPSPCPTGRRCPTHRLRSKRSRLRLQIRERESDTDDSQGGLREGEGVRERKDEMLGQEKVGVQAGGEGSIWEMGSVEGQENRDNGTRWSEEVKNRSAWTDNGGDGEACEEMARSVSRDGVGGSERSSAEVLQRSANKHSTSQSGTDEFLVNRLAGEIFPNGQSGAKGSPAISSQSSVSNTDQLLMLAPSDQSSNLFNKPNEGVTQSVCLQAVRAETVEGCEDNVTMPCSSGKAGILESCTLVDGLPFPVEYYIRTTRRMSAAHSTIDLNAVIQSQLTRGRGRRRSGLPQTRRGGHVTSDASNSSGKPLDPHPQTRGRGHRGRRGRKGRRGCWRTRAVGTTRSPTGSCIAGHSQVEPSAQSDSLSESATRTDCLLQSQSSLSVESLPQAMVTPQSEVVPYPGLTLNTEQVVAEDFKHLSDSQLYLDCKSLPDSDVYPIFRRRCGQAERGVMHSQMLASTNDCTPLLPSLASVAQALKKKDVQNIGHLLKAFDLQDFHLPDDVFGQLKLERLRLSCASVEPPVLHHTPLNASHGKGCRSNSRYSFRNCIDGSHLEIQAAEREGFMPEVLPPSASLEDSCPLSQLSPVNELMVETCNANQSEMLTEPMNQLHSNNMGQSTKLGHHEDQEPEDHVQLSNTHQLHESVFDGNDAANTPENHNGTFSSVGPGQNPGEMSEFQSELHMHGPNEASKLTGESCLSPVVPALSLSLTSRSQRGPDPSFPSVGATPQPLTSSSHSVLIPLLSSPSNQKIASYSSQSVVAEPVLSPAPGMVAIKSLTPRETLAVGWATVQDGSPAEAGRGSEEDEVRRLGHECAESAEPARELFRNPDTEKSSQHTSELDVCEKFCNMEDTFLVESLPQDIAQCENGLRNICELESHPQTINKAQRQTEPGHEGQTHSKALSPAWDVVADIDRCNNLKPSITTQPTVLLGASANQSVDDETVLLSKRAEPSQANVKHHLDPMTYPAHLVNPSPEVMGNAAHLVNPSPEVMGNAAHLVNPSPEVMGNAAHLVNPSPEAMGNAAHLVNLSPEAMGNAAHLVNPSPEVMGNAAHLVNLSPEVMGNAAHLVNPSPEVMGNAAHLVNPSPEVMGNAAHLVNPSPEAMDPPQKQHETCCKVLSSHSLHKTHTFKALEAGCVLDVCLVEWPSEGRCVCVAGEWSMCVWAQKVGVQQWDLLHTWTFTQSVISLQEVPDSAGLLCVCLGRLDITEARILCCPSMDGRFSQVEVYKGSLQAVVAVSDCRLVCCPAPGAHHNATVFTLTQDGRIASSVTLASTNRSIRSLAAVEGERDALIGWSDCRTVLLWNMKSGQLLQTIRLAETVSMASCLRGYSYKGALCVLLQSASMCCDGVGAAPFTLVAMNPLTGKHLPLPPITSPAPPAARLLDGDVCESNLVGVFQSGHLVIWDLRGGMASVFEDGVTELCRLARWAGPNVLLTGYLSGDVSLYQYKPIEATARCH